MSDDTRASDGPTIIAPVDFRGVGRAPRRRRSPWRLVLPALLVVLGAGLLAAGWFVLTAQQIELTFDPPADRVALEGPLPHFRISGNYLLRPGAYVVRATRAGYHSLEKSFVVGAGQEGRHEFSLEKLPGRLDVRVVGADDSEVALPGVDVVIDGRPAGPAPLLGAELTPGVHAILIRSARYQDLETEVDILGEGRTQTLDLELRPDWAEVSIATSPVAAEVWVDGSVQATTPCRIDLDSGSHDIELRAEGFEVWRRTVEVVAETPVTMTDIVLTPNPGRLLVRTQPSGAQVTVDGAYVGTSPLELEVAPDQDVAVRMALDGYDPVEWIARVASGAMTERDFELNRQYGTVRFDVIPADATLFVDGSDRGTVPDELSLPAIEHEFEFTKSGFVPVVRTVRPRPDLPQRIRVELEPVPRALPKEPIKLAAANGYPLTLIRPGSFTMGAPRGEPGRRTNETLRTIRLERPFYMGVREVTNEEFRAFRAEHESGLFEGMRLNEKTQPAVRVTWDDAARFCNWLSAQDRLPPAYAERDGHMEAVSPIANGYRLPTEAEWEFGAREDGSGTLIKFPWGAAFPPAAASGNYADESAVRWLAPTIGGYNDGHPVTAPVASFGANARGLHDLGGNVAEWCHDFYGIYTYDERRIDTDPVGPERGRHRVIRGSSWRHASISELRFTYRDYSAAQRDDVGFRICRYLTPPEDSP